MRTVSEKGTQQELVALKAPAVASRLTCQAIHFGGRQIGEGIRLQVGPQILDGIEFGSIGRQPFIPDPGVALDSTAHRSGAVAGQPIPDDNHRGPQMALELAQEVRDQGNANVLVGMEAKVQ